MAASVGGPVAVLAGVALANGRALAGSVAEARSIVGPMVPVLATIDPLGEDTFPVAATAHLLSWIEDRAADRSILDGIVRAARGSSAVTALPFPLAVLSELDLRSGRIDPAYAAATEAVQLAVDMGLAVESTLALVTLARVEAVLGREADCRSHVAAALEVAGRLSVTSIDGSTSSNTSPV